MATGVAKPKAHGQAMTMTEMAKLKDVSKFFDNTIFIMKVSRAMPRIIGTKTPDTLSANLEIGALELLASSTSFIMLAIDVFSPTFVALILIYPALIIVDEKTVSFFFFQNRN